MEASRETGSAAGGRAGLLSLMTGDFLGLPLACSTPKRGLTTGSFGAGFSARAVFQFLMSPRMIFQRWRASWIGECRASVAAVRIKAEVFRIQAPGVPKSCSRNEERLRPVMPPTFFPQ